MAEAQLQNVPIAELDRSHNVRRSLGDMADLVESIREVGVLTPVTVAPKEGGGWHLVAGHRRTAAAEEVGLETVPALVHTAGDVADRLLATLIENLQRLDLDPVEEAGGYRQLVDAGWSQADVARGVHRSRGHVSRRLKLLSLPDEVQTMVSEGTVTVEHAYSLSRLVDKGVDAEDVTTAAEAPPEIAADQLLEIETAERREHRRRKLERAGTKVILVDRLHQARERYDLEVSWMRLDGDHSGEPCHVVILHYGYYGRRTIDEAACCTDRTRHEAGGDSPLKVPDARQETDEERREREDREARQRAEHEARLAQEKALFDRLTDQVTQLPDEVAIAAVLRRVARETLRRPRYEDPLLPVPADVVDPDEGWMVPAQVIDTADLGDLARAVVRHLLPLVEQGYYHSRRPMHPIKALAETLPPLTDDQLAAEGAAYPDVEEEEVA